MTAGIARQWHLLLTTVSLACQKVVWELCALMDKSQMSAQALKSVLENKLLMTPSSRSDSEPKIRVETLPEEFGPSQNVSQEDILLRTSFP